MEMTIKTSQIAENIKAIRVMFNLTQVEMADKLGYSERQIRRLESSGTSNLEVINLISTTFNISAWDILASRMSWFVFIDYFFRNYYGFFFYLGQFMSSHLFILLHII